MNAWLPGIGFAQRRSEPLGRVLVFCAVLMELLLLLQVHPAAAKTGAVLLVGPIAGGVTNRTANIWFRTDKKANVSVRYSSLPTLEHALTTPVQATNAKNKFAALVSLTTLNPRVTYYYQIVLDGVPQNVSPYPHFTTFAGRGGPPVNFSFGILTDFGSNGAVKPERPLALDTFKHIAAENPAFIIIGGDFWHNEQDSTDAPVLGHQDFINRTRSRYTQMYSHNSTQGPYDDFVNLILPNFALAHQWDDHDIGRNNTNKNFFYKGDALAMLSENFPTYPMSSYGDWQKFSYGQADIFLLDSRSQRDSDLDPDGGNKSMLNGDNLGKAGQWRWLTSGLASSTARWKIILSPVVFNTTMHKHDAWNGFQNEHDRLLQWIRAKKISGVFFISGDAHTGGMDDGTNVGLPEMLVPGPNMKSSCFTAQSTGTWSNGIYGQLNNVSCPGYGMVYISTNPDRAELQVKDDKGNVKLDMVLSP